MDTITSMQAQSIGQAGRMRDGGLWELGVENHSDIAHVCPSQALQHGNQVEKFVIMGVIEPTGDGNSVVWVVEIGGGRVVDNDGLLDVATNVEEVLKEKM